jgi:acid stress chaperone HdeB
VAIYAAAALLPATKRANSVGSFGGGFMKTVAAVFVAGILAWSAPAFADDIDLSTWTCQKFRSASKGDVEVILSWLDGYYKDEDDPPVIDTDKFVDNAKKLSEYCSAHPDIGLITATDKLFQKD